jgi:thioredoxin 1
MLNQANFVSEIKLIINNFMLYTNLTHIETDAEYKKAIREYKNAVIVCGSMSQTCIPVYRIAEEFENEYPHVKFFDMEYLNPESHAIRNLSRESDALPFIVFYMNGKVLRVSSDVQTIEKLKSLLDEEYPVSIISTL